MRKSSPSVLGLATKLLITATFLFTFGCSTIERDYKAYQANRRGVHKKKFSKRLSPSDLMQVGIPKKDATSDNFDFGGNSIFDYHGSARDSNPTSGNGQYGGYYKVGNPYVIDGTNYYPTINESYKETGIASWYGDEFHGRKTANGETYDSGTMTAAHRTLPLPSMVRVTNIENGKSAIVRVNDRGPFAKSRIIDVSEKAAHVLGFMQKGTTKVRVEFLKEETDELFAKLGIVRK